MFDLEIKEIQNGCKMRMGRQLKNQSVHDYLGSPWEVPPMLIVLSAILES